jgi:hypothetical protein
MVLILLSPDSLHTVSHSGCGGYVIDNTVNFPFADEPPGDNLGGPPVLV